MEFSVRTHYFSRPMARRYGVRGAIILRFLSLKVLRSKNLREGKAWFFDSITAIAARYTYMPSSTLWDTMQSLIKAGAIETGRFNRRANDRTTWYTVQLPLMEQVNEQLIGLDVETATMADVCSGVLLNHLRYWRTKQNRNWHHMSPVALADSLPFSESGIKRSLNKLLLLGLIAKHSARMACYRLTRER